MPGSAWVPGCLLRAEARLTLPHGPREAAQTPSTVVLDKKQGLQRQLQGVHSNLGLATPWLCELGQAP